MRLCYQLRSNQELNNIKVKYNPNRAILVKMKLAIYSLNHIKHSITYLVLGVPIYHLDIPYLII